MHAAVIYGEDALQEWRNPADISSCHADRWTQVRRTPTWHKQAYAVIL